VQSCIFCRERLEILQESPDLSELTSVVAGRNLKPDRTALTLTDISRRNPDPAPGQIWSLKPHLGGWGPEAAYFNPPLILILSLPQAPIQAVRVAQIFHEPDLAGPEDVQLSQEQGLAQAWNTFTLADTDLDTYLGSVADKVLEEVLAQAGGSHPDPKPLGILEAFRELEIKTASITASRSLFSALTWDQSAENTPLEQELLDQKDPEALRRQIQTDYPNLHLPGDQNLSAQSLLGLASWDNLPLAAAVTEREITINCCWLDQEQDVHICPGRAVITVVDHSEQGLFIAGRIIETNIRAKFLYAWLLAGSRPYAADQAKLTPDGKYFQLAFSHPAGEDFDYRELKLLLLGRKGGE
jgi:hypothetical protein